MRERVESASATLCADSGLALRLAVLIAGECRTFREPLVQAYMVRNLLLASEADLRVFASLTDEPRPTAGCREGLHLLNVTAYSPARVEQFNRHCPLAPVEYWCNGMCASDNGMPPHRNQAEVVTRRILKAVSAITTAYELMIAHESATSWRADWVLRTRPDLLYYRSMQPLCLYDLSTHNIYHQHTDFAMLVPRRLAEVVFDMASRYRNCTEGSPTARALYGARTPETFYTQMIASHPRRPGGAGVVLQAEAFGILLRPFAPVNATSPPRYNLTREQKTDMWRQCAEVVGWANSRRSVATASELSWQCVHVLFPTVDS